MPRLLVLALTLAVAGCGGGSPGTKTTSTSGSGVRLGPAFGPFDTLPGIQTGAPPWGPGNGTQLKPRLLAMGLAPLPQEGTVVHIHQHLDLYVDGRKITVPALIGISIAQKFFSPIHTHDTTGIIHVESATASAFSLGQAFGVWGVPLAADRIGGLGGGGGKLLRTWVNGRPVAGDPTRIVLDAHQEIVIAYGTQAQMPKTVPSSYAFPAGL